MIARPQSPGGKRKNADKDGSSRYLASSGPSKQSMGFHRMASITRLSVLLTLGAILPASFPVWAPGQAMAQAVETGEVVTGRATVLEGDRLSIDGGTPIRLYGVEAPSDRQPCFLEGKEWACGPVSTRNLEIIIADRPVSCRLLSDPNPRRRAYVYGRCEVAGTDLAAEMVRLGWAVAFDEQSTEYLPLEEAPRTGRQGLWAAEYFQAPWLWDEEQMLLR